MDGYGKFISCIGPTRGIHLELYSTYWRRVLFQLPKGEKCVVPEICVTNGEIKILDLKGTPKAEQNHLLDSFITITSTKDELQGTSFLSSLDMDPPTLAQLGATLTSPGALSATESIFSGLVSPPMSGPPTGSTEGVRNEQRREVFSDFRRFVSFGLRRDSQAPS